MGPAYDANVIASGHIPATMPDCPLTMPPATLCGDRRSRVDHVPAFNLGLPNQVFRQFIVTHPRFLPGIIVDGIGTGCPVR